MEQIIRALHQGNETIGDILSPLAELTIAGLLFTMMITIIMVVISGIAKMIKKLFQVMSSKSYTVFITEEDGEERQITIIAMSIRDASEKLEPEINKLKVRIYDHVSLRRKSRNTTLSALQRYRPFARQ